jgi:hypothetical protein
MHRSITIQPIAVGVRLLLGFMSICAIGVALALYFYQVRRSLQPDPMRASETDPIVDIWINKMIGYFFVVLPDNTVKLYESYSLDLHSLGRWKKVEDRAIYPESPKVCLPSYRIELESDRIVDVFLYPVAHHSSIAIEDRIIGHRGYNRLSDVDDPNGFYHQKFSQGLPQELSIVNGYWKRHHGRPFH